MEMSSSRLAMDDELRLGRRCDGGEIVAIDRRRDAEQQRRAFVRCADAHRDPRSERDAGGPEREAGEALRGRNRRAAWKSSFSPGPASNVARAAADAAEIEAQRRDADARHRLGRLIHRLGVHRPAVRRHADAPKTATARGSPSGRSRSASSGPAGPGISRRKSAIGSPPSAVLRGFDERAHGVRKHAPVSSSRPGARCAAAPRAARDRHAGRDSDAVSGTGTTRSSRARR